MKRLIAAICFMLAATPFAFAQEKAKDTEKKAPVAAEKSAKPEMPKGAQAASEKTKGSTMGAEMSPKGEQVKKEPSEKQKAQQGRMKDCAAKAGDRKGDDRKNFMSSCLKGQDAEKKSEKATTKTAQQTKMGGCNKEAKEKTLKGDERKKFMKDCLSK